MNRGDRMDGYAGIKDCLRVYWDMISCDYERLRGCRSDEEKIAWKYSFQKHLNIRKGRILDVGTGTGFVARILAELGHEVTAIDISKKMIEIAREIALRKGQSVDFRVGDAENLEFEDCTFDAVVCRYVLWTLPDPERAVREWARVTRSGGKVVIVDGVWCDGTLLSRIKGITGKLGLVVHERINPLRFGYGRDMDSTIPFVNGVKPDCLVRILRACGFEKITVEWLDNVKKAWLKNLPVLLRLSWNRPIYIVSGVKRK